MAKAEEQKAKLKPSKKTQFERFLETARKLGCDESKETFEQTFLRIVSAKPKPKVDPVRPSVKPTSS